MRAAAIIDMLFTLVAEGDVIWSASYGLVGWLVGCLTSQCPVNLKMLRKWELLVLQWKSFKVAGIVGGVGGTIHTAGPTTDLS